MSLAEENVGNKSDTQTTNKNIVNVSRHGSMQKGVSKNRQGNLPISQDELNPDVIPNRHKAQVLGHMNHQKNNSSGMYSNHILPIYLSVYSIIYYLVFLLC